MKLCLVFGFPNTDALEEVMSYRQFKEWYIYNAIEPIIGEERADLRAGIIASTIANVNRSKKNQKSYKPKDFMPFHSREKGGKGQTAKGIWNMMMAMTKKVGGTIINPKKKDK